MGCLSLLQGSSQLFIDHDLCAFIECPQQPSGGGYYYLCLIDEGTDAQTESHWAKARQAESRKPGFEPQSVTLALTYHLMTTCGA